jgi:hypothetical protein
MGTPGGAHVIDEARQVGDAGCWRVDAFAVRVPQDPEQAAHLGQGAARSRGNGVEGGAGLVGTTLEHVGADAGLHGDHRHRVGDHVVQFLRNPQPFFGEHAASALALDIGTFLCLAHAHLGRLATRAHGDADRPHRAVGGEVAHQADRVEPWCVADPNHYERGVDGSEAGNSPSLGLHAATVYVRNRTTIGSDPSGKSETMCRRIPAQEMTTASSGVRRRIASGAQVTHVVTIASAEGSVMPSLSSCANTVAMPMIVASTAISASTTNGFNERSHSTWRSNHLTART